MWYVCLDVQEEGPINPTQYTVRFITFTQLVMKDDVTKAYLQPVTGSQEFQEGNSARGTSLVRTKAVEGEKLSGTYCIVCACPV